MVRIQLADRSVARLLSRAAVLGIGGVCWAWLTGAAAWAQTAPGGLSADGARPDLIPTKNLFDMLLAGGPMSVPIVLASFVMLLVVFERAVSLRRRRVVPRLFVERFLLQIREGALDRSDALARCEKESSHIARVFAAALRKWGKPAVEVEQAVLDEGERTGNVLRRYLRVINGVATVCPLFGLLGTVWGMMEAFNVIATNSAMGRAELLAGGISGALVSTAAGLFVAIPALIFYLYFVGRVDRLVMDIDAYGQELVGLISAEGLEQGKIGRSAIHRRKAA
jgi:biopolymer transport protein ExbB